MPRPTRGPISLFWADARLAPVRVRVATAKARSFTGNLLCQRRTLGPDRGLPALGRANRRQYSGWTAIAKSGDRLVSGLRSAQMCSRLRSRARRGLKRTSGEDDRAGGKVERADSRAGRFRG